MRPLAILLAFVLPLAVPAAGQAATFAVDRSDDPAGAGACSGTIANDCSLRQAVADAEQAAGADTITLQSAALASEITYGGADLLTIVSATAARAAITTSGSGALHLLPGAGPMGLIRLRFIGSGVLPTTGASLLLVESTNGVQISDVDLEHRTGPPIGALRVAPTVSVAAVGLEDFSTVDAAVVLDAAAVTLLGGSVRAPAGTSGVTATGASTLHVIATSVEATGAAAIDLGNGSLLLRHATLSTDASTPLVAATAGATIDAGYSLLIGGSACFDAAAATTSAGYNLTGLTALQCPTLTEAGDATGLMQPTLSAVDAVPTCGDNGAGMAVTADRWGLRPVDGNGDQFPRCDVGAREHGTDGSLSFTESGGDAHVGDPVTATLLVQRDRSPEGSSGRHAEITIEIPASLAFVSATSSAGISCGAGGTTLVCSIADASADAPLATGSIGLTLTALTTTGTYLAVMLAHMREVLTSADGVTSTSAVMPNLFGVRITPAPPPRIIDPPIVKRFPNAYAGCTIVGTSGADHIVGTAKSDVICALGGNDVIDGKGGGDHIIGGDGKDRIDGGAGKDWIEGGPGNDRLHGGAGADLISGGLGRDRIWGGAGDDRLSGGRGFDVLDGQAGKDRATGAAHDRTKRIEHGAAKRKTRAKKS